MLAHPGPETEEEGENSCQMGGGAPANPDMITQRSRAPHVPHSNLGGRPSAPRDHHFTSSVSLHPGKQKASFGISNKGTLMWGICYTGGKRD